MKKHHLLLNGIINTIIGSILTFFFFTLLIKSNNVKFLMLPFIIISIIITINGITNILQDINLNSPRTDIDKIGNMQNFQKIKKKTTFIYHISFYIFWFTILIIGDIEAIKVWNNAGKFIFLFSLLFWATGIISIIKLIKTNKKEANNYEK